MNLIESVFQGLEDELFKQSANPFTPTFGHVPFALAGRTDYIDDVFGGLANSPGDPNRSTIFVGPRGSGKTVLLTAITREAADLGWVCVDSSARAGMLSTIARRLQKNSEHLLTPPPLSDVVGVQMGPAGFTRRMRDAQPKDEIACIEETVEYLCEHGACILFTVDEVDATCKEFCDFVDLYQYFMRKDLDVALLLAGLPSQVSTLLSDEGISFIRRAFQRPLDRIPLFDVEQALLETIEQNGREIESDALALAASASGGFAFAIQLIGYYLWRQGSATSPLQTADVQQAIDQAKQEMERSIFAPTLRELRPREVEYLCAMLKDTGPSSTSSIAHRMGVSMTNASNLRRRLIEHGVIREVRMGLVEFEMPLIDEYLRTMDSSSNLSRGSTPLERHQSRGILPLER